MELIGGVGLIGDDLGDPCHVPFHRGFLLLYNVQAFQQSADDGGGNLKPRGRLSLDTAPNMLFVECPENPQLNSEMGEKAAFVYTFSFSSL